MKTSILIIFLTISIKILSQDKDTDRYGPCNSYLNILGYHYNINDLRKDTLKFQRQGSFPAVTFIQNKTKLLNAIFVNRNGKEINSGTFKDGNGKLIVEFDNFNRMEYNFQNGMLNDTSTQISMNKKSIVSIYIDNILTKEIWYYTNGNPHFINNYANGELNDTLFVFGESKTLLLPFKDLYFNIHTGIINEITIYDHGQCIERVWYNKDGSTKRQEKYKNLHKPKPKPVNKNCL